jgi:hypothetical protein
MARFLKSVPRDVTPSIGCSTQLTESAVRVTRESGLIAQRPFLVVSLFFWVPEALSHDDESERSLLAEMLEVLFAGLLKERISSPFRYHLCS